MKIIDLLNKIANGEIERGYKFKYRNKIDNSLATKITTGDVVIKFNDNNKSLLEIGNIKVYNIKKFNWLQRKMFKIFFGIKIKNLYKGE